MVGDMWKVALIWITVAVCEASPSSRQSGSKVQLEVYYETNCPDSMRFVTGQLYPAYREMRDILDITLVPFGKAHETYDSVSKKYVFRCQHGEAECYGNRVQSCAISMYPDTQEHLNFVYCMEQYARPSDHGGRCARILSLDWGRLSKCAEGDEGNRLMHQMAGKTNALNPRLNFVPWIRVNKVHTNQQQSRSLRDLKKVICDNYKGNHPKC